MRVLVATTAGAGHLGPLVPFARALQAGGHDVAVAAPASFALVVERAAFTHLAFADGSPAEHQEVFAGLAGLTNHEANVVVLRDVFARISARAALPGMTELLGRWRPDLVLRETAEFASYVAAESAGIPQVQVGVSLAAFEEMYLPAIEESLAELGSGSGAAGLVAMPRLSLLPASFDGPATAGVLTTARYREGADRTGTPLPDWWDGSSLPLVYVTFGSVAGGLGLFPSLYQQVMAMVAGLPVRVLMTTGEVADLDLLGPAPDNVHVERWWPQDDVMPHAAAMVGHGGLGTTLLGLVAGVPMVVVPLFADQPDNAARVAAVGAGIALDGGSAAVAGLADALQQVLSDERYQTAARSVAEEIARLPHVSEAVPFLEQVAAGG